MRRLFSGWLLPALFILACSQDWAAPQTDAGEDAQTTDASADGHAQTSADGSAELGDAVASCVGSDCGRGTCNPRGSCDCEEGHRFDGARCQPNACAAAGADPVCGANERCSEEEGVARCVCQDGFSLCAGRCVDLQIDRENCGACGYACAGSLACRDGACEQPVHALVSGPGNNCALLGSSTEAHPLRCWGTGKLFRDGAGDALTPREVVGVPAVRALALSERRACALLPGEDVVRCWGECGRDCGRTDTTIPGRTQGVPWETFTELTEAGAIGLTSIAGFEYSGLAGNIGGNTCMLTRDGAVRCYGWAPFITDEDNMSPAPLRTARFGPLQRYTAIAAAEPHNTCALVATGAVLCWGIVSDPPTRYASFVRKKSGEQLDHVVSMAPTIAATSAGELYRWPDLDMAGAEKVEGIADAVQVTPQLLVRLRSGKVVGYDYLSSAFQPVPQLEDALEVVGGLETGCARRRNGAVVCWGSNQNGSVGDGTFIGREEPAAVVGLF